MLLLCWWWHPPSVISTKLCDATQFAFKQKKKVFFLSFVVSGVVCLCASNFFFFPSRIRPAFLVFHRIRCHTASENLLFFSFCLIFVSTNHEDGQRCATIAQAIVTNPIVQEAVVHKSTCNCVDYCRWRNSELKMVFVRENVVARTAFANYWCKSFVSIATLLSPLHFHPWLCLMFSPIVLRSLTKNVLIVCVCVRVLVSFFYFFQQIAVGRIPFSVIPVLFGVHTGDENRAIASGIRARSNGTRRILWNTEVPWTFCRRDSLQ